MAVMKPADSVTLVVTGAELDLIRKGLKALQTYAQYETTEELNALRSLRADLEGDRKRG